MKFYELTSQITQEESISTETTVMATKRKIRINMKKVKKVTKTRKTTKTTKDVTSKA